MKAHLNRDPMGHGYGLPFALSPEDAAIVEARVSDPRAAQRADVTDGALMYILAHGIESSSDIHHGRRAFPREEILKRAD